MSPTRRLSRADIAREHTLEWLMARDDAETRFCRACWAQPGVTCVNVHTGRPLEAQAAHLVRLTAPAPRSPSVPPVLPRPAEPSTVPVARAA